MMDSRKKKFDIVNEVLEDCILAYPVSAFIISLYKQYLQRGSLSKKQLLGLYGKAGDIENYPPARLATLEALIKKMPNRYKSDLPDLSQEADDKDSVVKQKIESVLEVFPAHKRVLFLQALVSKNTPLSASDLADIERFFQLATSKKQSSK